MLIGWFVVQLPLTEEIEAMLAGKKQTAVVFFLDETFEELEYDATTTVLEAVEFLAGVIKLQNYQTFTLYECRKVNSPSYRHLMWPIPMRRSSWAGVVDVVLLITRRSALVLSMIISQIVLRATPANLFLCVQVIKAPEIGGPIADEHYILDDNKYIADIIQEFKAMKGRDYQSKVLFKKRMFRETDETITEPQFVTLSYVQVRAYSFCCRQCILVLLPVGIALRKTCVLPMCTVMTAMLF